MPGVSSSPSHKSGDGVHSDKQKHGPYYRGSLFQQQHRWHAIECLPQFRSRSTSIASRSCAGRPAACSHRTRDHPHYDRKSADIISSIKHTMPLAPRLGRVVLLHASRISGSSQLARIPRVIGISTAGTATGGAQLYSELAHWQWRCRPRRGRRPRPVVGQTRRRRR